MGLGNDEVDHDLDRLFTEISNITYKISVGPTILYYILAADKDNPFLSFQDQNNYL